MAKISLRAYLREIENLIDQGELEQAQAHCRNILNYYPKNIETYRLLGKSYLEGKKYKGSRRYFFSGVLFSRFQMISLLK